VVALVSRPAPPQADAQVTVKRTILLVFCAVLVSSCGNKNTRDHGVKRLESSLRSSGFRFSVADRHGPLVGPPEIAACDPPLTAALRNDPNTRHGYATIYVCSSRTDARTAIVPAGFPGTRYIRSNVIAIVTGDAGLNTDVLRAIHEAVG
jgi:hypothetical protein